MLWSVHYDKPAVSSSHVLVWHCPRHPGYSVPCLGVACLPAPRGRTARFSISVQSPNHLYYCAG